MKSKITSGLLAAMVIITLFSGTSLAYTQDEIDTMTGPALGVSNTYIATDYYSGPKIDESGVEHGEFGELIGIARTTEYCPCSKCCGSNTLTYSGTVPSIKHTVAADPSIIPIGTRIMIEGSDIIYTVEDIGSAVKGLSVDIFVGSHDEALAYGVQMKNIYYAK